MEEKKKDGRGRKKGSKDSIPRVRSKKNEQRNLIESDTGTEVKTKNIPSIIKHLSGEARKLYKEYAIDYEHPVDALKEIAKMMHVRHHTALMTELQEWETNVKNAKEALIEVETTGKVSGRVANREAVSTRIRNLRAIINAKLHLSSQLTTLQGELIKIYETIDRIESGRPNTSISIYQIMSGKGDKLKNAEVKKNIFTLPPELMEEEDYEDIDVKSNPTEQGESNE